MEITCFSDYACPYCYIGEKRLQKAIEELGVKDQVKIELRAFELDPGAAKTVQSDTATRFAAKYRLPLDEAKARIEHISRLGREEGIDFNYAESQYTSTFDAHRLMKFALSKKDALIAEKTNEYLFDAYFTKSLRLADHETLLAVAELAGLGKDETRKMLDSDEFAQEVRADEAEAVRLGIHGVPYFIFAKGMVIPGAASKDDFKKLLQQNLGVKDQPWRVESCGPDGCRL